MAYSTNFIVLRYTVPTWLDNVNTQIDNRTVDF